MTVIVDYSFSVLGAFAVLIIGIIAASMISRWSRRRFNQLSSVDETLAAFLSNLIRYAILVLVLVTVLAQFGVKTTSILAALGAAGLAIGLALQGTLANVAAGIMLLILRPFKIGEYIEAGDTVGTVEEIGLFTTVLRRPDGLFVMAPNGQIWNRSILNYSRHPTRRFDLVVGIGYDDDIAKAKKTLLEIASSNAAILKDPEPVVYVSALGNSAVNIGLRVWINTSDFLSSTWELTEAAKLKFDKAGLSIPYPQMDVHTK
ncbi:MAG: mechanosensitive ion channel [Rhizobiales bacterium]|nr:mechanosensitive ion channel [Hyphomicrobiales bacterium]